MRILQLVAGEKWTGAAAVVFDQTAALVAAGVEAQFGFVGDTPLAARLLPLGWARPLLSRSRTPPGVWRNVRFVRDTLLRESFDVVHCHLSHDHFVGAAAVRGTGVLLARTFHHVDAVRRDVFSRALFRRTDAFASSNREIAARLERPGPVHPPVVDAQRFRPGEGPEELLRALGMPGNRFVVGTVGKIAAGRGHREAVQSARALPADAVLLHVGKGEVRGEVQALAASLGTADRNFWAGYEEDGLPGLYRAMDVFLFTASGSEQGQRALLEAMASGVPVVARDVPGVADLVTDGREGLIVGSEAGVAPALKRLYDSPEERLRMGEQGRRRALEFGPEAFAREARRFYERLSARNARTSRAWDAGETAG